MDSRKNWAKEDFPVNTLSVLTSQWVTVWPCRLAHSNTTKGAIFKTNAYGRVRIDNQTCLTSGISDHSKERISSLWKAISLLALADAEKHLTLAPLLGKQSPSADLDFSRGPASGCVTSSTAQPPRGFPQHYVSKLDFHNPFGLRSLELIQN